MSQPEVFSCLLLGRDFVEIRCVAEAFCFLNKGFAQGNLFLHQFDRD